MYNEHEVGNQKVCTLCGEDDQLYLQNPHTEGPFHRCESCGDYGVITVKELIDMFYNEYWEVRMNG
jgi:hypothetical protein